MLLVLYSDGFGFASTALVLGSSREIDDLRFTLSLNGKLCFGTGALVALGGYFVPGAALIILMRRFPAILGMAFSLPLATGGLSNFSSKIARMLLLSDGCGCISDN